MGGVRLAFESKAPHTTPWLSIEFDVDDEPTTFLQRLAAEGWEEDERYARVPPLDGRQEIHVGGPAGSGLFGGWKDQEKRRNMRAIRELLRNEGFVDVPWNKLTLADLL